MRSFVQYLILSTIWFPIMLCSLSAITDHISPSTSQTVHFINLSNGTTTPIETGPVTQSIGRNNAALPTSAPVAPTTERKATLKRKTMQRKKKKQTKTSNTFDLFIPSETKVIEAWQRTDSRVLFIDDLLNSKLGARFYDARICNYSQLVILPKQSAIYVVENKVTLLKLDMTSFFLLDSYTLPAPDKSLPNCLDSETCHQAKEISLLAVMPNDQMVWFCYLHYFQYVNRPPRNADSACMVPQPGNLAEPVVQWDNPHFNSLDPTHMASVLNANDGFTYISAFTPDYLRIFRAHMPDWHGRVNWTGALVTAKGSFYIAEPAKILLTFETENEVYFVLREQQTGSFRATRASMQTGSDFESTVSDVARLIRICKGDRGGLPHRSSEIFGTFAKAELHCAAADNSGGSFVYTHLQSVYWENSTERLFASFGTERWAPVGSALCVYNKRDIEAAFNGPLLQPAMRGVSHMPTPIPNSFPNICQRFNSKNLTSEELVIGRRLSLRFPNRNNAIQPMYKKALIVQTGVAWIHLQAYSLPPLPTHYHFGNPAQTTVVWLGTRDGLTRLAIYEDPEAIRNDSNRQPTICKLNEFLVGRSLDLLNRPQAMTDLTPITIFRQLKSSQSNSHSFHSEHPDSLVLQYLRRSPRRFSRSMSGEKSEQINQISVHFPRIFIITDRQLLWLPLTDCSVYKTSDQCIHSNDPHCGWSWSESRCANGYDVAPTLSTSWFNTYSPSIDRRRPENAQCPNENGSPDLEANSGAWSTWYTCRWLDNDDQQSSSVNPDAPVKVYRRSYGICRCRVCLGQSECVRGTQEVINCTQYERNWLLWSAWSPCDVTTGLQTRQRSCRAGTVCTGSNREQRLCTPKSIWSGRFDALVATAARRSSTSSSPLPRDGFTMTHLILVAICSVLIGGVLTSLIFCLLWQPWCVIPGPSECNCSRLKSQAHAGRNRSERKKTHRIGSVNTEENWDLPDDSKNPAWSGIVSDQTGNWSKSQQSSTFYEPLIASKFKLKKPQNRESRTGRGQNRCESSSNLLTPSPNSVISGNSTTSTVLKDKFTFDQFDGNDEFTAGNSLRVPSVIPSLGSHPPTVADHTLV